MYPYTVKSRNIVKEKTTKRYRANRHRVSVCLIGSSNTGQSNMNMYLGDTRLLIEVGRKHGLLPESKRSSESWIGVRYKQLEIIAFEGIRKFKRGRSAYFRFRCDCGTEFTAQKSNVIGKRKDCGCTKPISDRTAPRGAYKNPLHKVWWHMIDRCENPNNSSYHDYGARGIRVCKRWKSGSNSKTGFECFLSDMGPHSIGMTVERVQRDGNYEPGNCVWLPKGDQSKNRRGVRLVRIGDQVKTIPEWCAETGISYWTAIQRVKRGWPPDRAVTEPVKHKGRLGGLYLYEGKQ